MTSAAASSRMTARTERRAIAALVAVFALLVQALIPSLAAAAAPPTDLGAICAATGAAHNPSGPGAPTHLPGGDCNHCVCPMAAAPPSAAAADPNPVRYAQAAAPVLLTREGLAPGRGLAAPPPPSRGPPLRTI